MRLTVNGQPTDLPDGATVADLLAGPAVGQLGQRIEADWSRVAVERNGQIVPRLKFSSTALEDGDSLEIVTLVGGG